MTAQLNRRSLLKGLSIFLGIPIINGLSEGCLPPPPQINAQAHHLKEVLGSSWRAPREMITLGNAILRAHPHVETEIVKFKERLDQRLISQDVKLTTELKREDAEKVAKSVYALHLEAAHRGEWVDVQGWRLSAVEASAYVLIATYHR